MVLACETLLCAALPSSSSALTGRGQGASVIFHSGRDILLSPTLDHVVLDVHEQLDSVAALYRQLGFTLTPLGRHTLGSVNHLAMFATDYLELLGWPPGRLPARPELLGHPLGMNGLVFKTADADATFARLRALGLAAGPPRSFSRPVVVDGAVRDAAFRTVFVAPDKSLIGRVYFCEHATPDLVWRPEWQQHANGAQAIHSLVIRSPEPDRVGALFGALFDTDAEQLRFQAGRAAIEIVSAPQAERSAIAILRIARAGPAETLPASEAGGVQIEFVPDAA